jgi:DNA-binding NarL/FixJ family response regulator
LEIHLATKKIKVLLVDDHSIVRNGIRTMINAVDDIEVTGEAASAVEALSIIQQKNFDIALLDIELPDSRGLDLLKLLRKKYPKLIVMMMSIYSEEIYATRALKCGASGYLSKDCSVETLISAIRKVAAGGRYVSQELTETYAQSLGSKKVSSHADLSDRELEVLKQLANGSPLVDIAAKLHLSSNTVTTYRGRILAKLGLRGNAALTRYAIENKLLS